GGGGRDGRGGGGQGRSGGKGGQNAGGHAGSGPGQGNAIVFRKKCEARMRRGEIGDTDRNAETDRTEPRPRRAGACCGVNFLSWIVGHMSPHNYGRPS